MNKINISSMRVLQMLQLLLEKNYSIDELVREMTALTGEPYNSFVLLKYINTCRYCGFDIQKIDSKYALLKLPFNIELSDEELNLLHRLETRCATMRVSKTVRNIYSLMRKLNRRSNRYMGQITLPEEDESFKNFECALKRKVKVEVCYQNEDMKQASILCDPLEISDEGGVFSILCNVDGEYKKFLQNEIISIKISDNVASAVPITTSVVFQLKNILAKRYTLRHGEKVLAVGEDGAITVSNKNEDKETLFRRLLKYGALCQIITPKSYKKEFLELINKTLANYDEI